MCADASWRRLGGSCYRYFNGFKRWTEAQGLCESRGANLAKADSSLVRNFILKIDGGHSSLVWVGATKNALSDIWRWKVDGSIVSNGAWAPGSPGQVNLSQTRCASFQIASVALVNRDCTTDHYPYVCEKQGEIDLFFSPSSRGSRFPFYSYRYIDSPIHSMTNTITYPLNIYTHLPTPTHSLYQSINHSLTRSSSHPLTHPIPRSRAPFLTHLLFIYSCILASIHSFVDDFFLSNFRCHVSTCMSEWRQLHGQRMRLSSGLCGRWLRL